MSKTNDNYIKIPNGWYDNKDLENDELTLLTFLYRNFMQYKNLSICSLQLLLDWMRYGKKNNCKYISMIKDIFYNLIEKGLILNLYDIYKNNINIDDIKNKDYIYYVELVDLPSDNYFMVYDSDMDKIFEYLQDKNLNKFNLFRYFIACRRVTNNQSKFGFLSQTKLKQLVDHSKTIQKYNTILQDELHLIRYNNNYVTSEKRYNTTFIGLYEDEKIFNDLVKFEVKQQELIRIDKTTSNKKRELKQKINNVTKDIEKNNQEEKIKELEELNKKYNSIAVNKPVAKDNNEVEVEFDLAEAENKQKTDYDTKILEKFSCRFNLKIDKTIIQNINDKKYTVKDYFEGKDNASYTKYVNFLKQEEREKRLRNIANLYC